MTDEPIERCRLCDGERVFGATVCPRCLGEGIVVARWWDSAAADAADRRAFDALLANDRAARAGVLELREKLSLEGEPRGVVSRERGGVEAAEEGEQETARGHDGLPVRPNADGGFADSTNFDGRR